MLTLVRPVDSPLGQRVVAFVPFLRSRYGRPALYTIIGMIAWLLSSHSLERNAFLTIMICGLAYFLIAMQPSNPMDYRGFQRP